MKTAKTESVFYAKKLENELALFEEEQKIKSQLKSFSNGGFVLGKIAKALPLIGGGGQEENKSSKPGNIFQTGIKLFKGIKEITHLTKTIVKQFKSKG